MKVGDYVITKDRLHIGKIYNINDFREPSMMYAINFPNVDDFIFMGENDFTSSPNIIDLLQVGDYVNGRIVDEFIYLDKLGLIGLSELEKEDEKFIKSIVTKEQFLQMEYKVGE